MAIRKTIVWTVAEDGISFLPADPQFGGVQGEDNAVKIKFVLGTDHKLVDDGKYRLYIECEDPTGAYDKTEALTPDEEGAIEAMVPLAWTQYGGVIKLNVVAEGDEPGKVILDGVQLHFRNRPGFTRRMQALIQTYIQKLLDTAKDMLSRAADVLDRATNAATSAMAEANSAHVHAGAAAVSAASASAAAEEAEGHASTVTILRADCEAYKNSAEQVAQEAEEKLEDSIEKAQAAAEEAAAAQEAAEIASDAAVTARNQSSHYANRSLSAAEEAERLCNSATAASSIASKSARDAEMSKQAAEGAAQTAANAEKSAAEAADAASESAEAAAAAAAVAAAGITADDELNTESENPVQNKVVAVALNNTNDSVTAVRNLATQANSAANTAKQTATQALNNANLVSDGLNATNVNVTELGKKVDNLPTIEVDDALNADSTNPVQNKAVALKLSQVEAAVLTTANTAINARNTATQAKEAVDGVIDLTNGFNDDIGILLNDVAGLKRGVAGLKRDVDDATGELRRLDEGVDGITDRVDAIDARVTALEKNGTGGGGGKLDVHEVEGYAFAVGDEDGNVSFGVRDNGKVVFDKGDYETYETDEYAYAVCDNNGNVVFAITEDGEVDYSGKGIGSGGGATLNYYQCGLPVLALVGDTSAMTKDNAVSLQYKLSTRKVATPLYTGTCTCKWQGSSSVRRGYPKRNYTIKFDTEFEATSVISTTDGVTAPTKWGEQKKYCMKANWIDPSAARNVVNARLWGEVVATRDSVHEKLAASPNYGAIDGFPVIILINGEFEGLYTFNIPKDDWLFNMGDGNAEYIVCGESNSMAACGFKAEATFIEGDSQADTDFAYEYQPDGVEDETVRDSFNNAILAVMKAPNATGWETAEIEIADGEFTTVADVFDIDSAIDYYIFACCIGGEDNLQKNILYATYDGVKWFMSAYDLDTTMGSNPYGTALYNLQSQKTKSFASAATRHRLFELIYKYSKDKLKARYAELRGSVLSDENVWYMYNNFVCPISRAVYNADAQKWVDKLDTDDRLPMPATTTANVENYIQYYRMHCALLDKEMEE